MIVMIFADLFLVFCFEVAWLPSVEQIQLPKAINPRLFLFTQHIKNPF
jgi:hypothetical protein